MVPFSTSAKSDFFCQSYQSTRYLLLPLLICFLFLQNYKTSAQVSSTCKEFIYLNSGNFDPNTAKIHKFQVGSSGPFTEVIVNGDAWYPGASGIDPSFNYPHGLGVDRNGFLYIGNAVFSPNAIRRFDCVGNLKPTSEFVINNPGELLTNIDSYAGFIYSNGEGNRIYKWDPCTGAAMGYVQLDDGSLDWGFSIDDNGKFYVTNTSGKIYAFTPTAANFTSNTTYSPVIDLGTNTTYGGLSPVYAGQGLQGITTDNAGNIYVVEGNRDSPGTPSRLLKFSPTFTFLAASPIDSDGGNGAGWNQMVGVVYSRTTNKLYTSSLNPTEDCLYSFDTNLNPVVAVVGPDPSGLGGKGLNILTECCPTSGTIDKSVCGVTIGERISLSDLISTDGGVVCDGQWSEVGTSSGLTFNQCDLTVTVTGNTACGTFTITNKNTPNKTCADYEITLNVSLLPQVTAQVIAGNQSICPEDNPTPFTITTAAFTIPAGGAISYQWQSSTTSATAGFTNITTGGNNDTYDSNAISQTTYYRVIASISGCTSGNCSDTSNVVTVTVKTDCCVKPVATATPQTQTICVGGTATAFTATPSTGVEYKWYGPLTTTTGSLGTAIAGQTTASFTPTGAALTTEGTKYYAVVVNTTGDVTCADTAFVTLNVSKITVPAATAQCHANGTPEDASDDYMTFTINVKTTPVSLNKFTVTATQGGNPLAITLSNGSPATAVNCGLDTPLRTPAGSAGKGNVTLTITDNTTGCTTTLVITDPGTCAVVCVEGTPSTVSYQYATQVDITDLDKLPIIIPKFDEQGGTRVLKSVKLEYTVGGKTAFVFENRAAQSQTFEATGTSEAYIELNGSEIATSAVTMPIPETTLPGGILVPAQGSWPGDSVQGSVPTTLGRMSSWVSDYLTVFKDPRIDPRWVTNATGDATDDDDMFFAQMVEDTASGSFTYTTAGALAPFIGTGSVPLNVSTLSGLSLAGGGGNILAIQRTRACASAKVTYTYECVTLCVKPVATVTPKTQTICLGGTASAYTATPSTGVEYKWYGPLTDTTSSLGTAIVSQTTASYTPTGTALTAAGTKYYAVIVNTTGDLTCADTAFVQLIINAKPVIADGIATICAGETVDLTTKITNYATYLNPVWTVATAGGTSVTTPTSVSPTATTTYVLVAENATGCKDTAQVVVTVNAKPNAGPDQTLACADASTNTLTTFTTLVPVTTGGTFTQIGTAPAVATIAGNAVSGMTVAGTYQFQYSVLGCLDTVAVTVEPCAGCVKPNAGPDVTLTCPPSGIAPTTATLVPVTTGGTWSAQSGNPATATVSGNAVSGMTTAGTYKFIYSVTGGGQICTDTVEVIVPVCVEPKGSIGDYVWKDADNDGVQDATEAPVAGVIVQLLQGTTVVATDTTNASGLYLFSNLSSGSYQVKILTASLPAGCNISTQKDLGGDDTKDSDIDPTTGLSPVIVIDALGTGIAKDNMTVDAALYSPKGSIGDYVWKDADNDGVQDATEAPVAGVIVQLLQGTTVVATDTTNASGLYLFSNLSSGSYQVKILTASLPAGCTISTQKDLGGDDTKDSDIDPTTGLSPVIVIDALGTGIAKDNMTVDAALYSPCVKPDAGPDQTLVCSTTAPSTANLVDAATGQKWKVLSVQPNTTVTVTTPSGDVTGMTAPGTYRFVLQTQSDSLACRDTVSIIVPDCSCPQVNILTPNATVCKDSLFPTLSIALLGSNTQGVSAAWYANATGGSSLGTGLSFKPAGTASVTDTFYVALTGASANCLALPRTPVIVTVQNCSVEVDLALKKSINTKIAQIGDELTYTIKVFNQLNVPATGVEVTDSIAATVQFVVGSFVASRGSATIVGNVIKWNIGGIAANAGANGDTVTLTYKVKATQEGVHFNTAEISKTNEEDIDSTPGDGKLGEDDIESQCFTVPFKLCPTEKVEVNVPAFLTNVQWFKDGGTAPIAAGNTVLLTELGTYTFTASNQTCPANGCCPIIIEPGVNCCPEDLCIPFTIQKVKKK